MRGRESGKLERKETANDQDRPALMSLQQWTSYIGFPAIMSCAQLLRREVNFHDKRMPRRMQSV